MKLNSSDPYNHRVNLGVDKAMANEYKNRIVNNDERTRFIVSAVVDRLQRGQYPGIVFVREKLHGAMLTRMLEKELAQQMWHSGTPCVEFVTADMSKSRRQELAERMRRKELHIAVATSVWATGLDIPCLRLVVWAGSGQAPIGLLQARGRGSRIDEGKQNFEFLIIDDVGLPNHEEQSRKRLEHLRDAGMLSDQQFLEQLRGHEQQAALQAEVRGQPTRSEDIGWGDIPLWFKLFFPLSPLSWLVYGTILATFAMICSLMEKQP